MKNKLFRAAASALLTLLLVITLLPVQAHAAGATLTGTAAPQAGDTVTLTLSVPNKVYGLTADLSYSGNLSFTNYNCSVSGWSIVVNNNKFSVYGTSSSSGGLVTIKMKVSGSAKEGDALTATFSNIVVSDGNSDTSLDSASWSGKVGAAPSGNCSLSSLSCSNATLSPSFSSSTTYYTCTVPFAVEKLDLNYKKADNSATVSVSGNELAVGVNTVTIKVTAANGATKSYTIDATRQQDPNYKPSTDASIAALTLEGATLSPAFTPTVTDYIAYVPYETKQVTIAATAKDEKAQGITGTGEVRLSATEAETVLTVTGTAEDGKTKQNYTIHVLRMPAYTGIVPTVEVIDPATIPEVPPLEIPGTIAMPLIGEVKTVYVAIAAAVLLVAVLFLLGFLITISEPDLQVLADQVPSIPSGTLILSVAAGVGLFLVFAFLRMLIGVALPKLLVLFYGLIFLLAAFVPKEFLAVAFDSGGVTTGPMTVPFIMALGVGVSAIRSDRHAADDSFGLVAMCSIGPILAVLTLGIAFRAADSTCIPPVLPEVADSVELWKLFREGLPTYLAEIARSLLPIVLMFGAFQLIALRLDRRTLGRIGVGLVYTYIGLVLFLTGANVGFMPAGNYLGQVLTGGGMRWVIIPIGMLIGYFIVKAEPAVYVLNKQVEEVTDGAISAQAMGLALSAGVSISVGLAMVRVLTGISILWFLVPGYVFAISISFVVPELFTAIAFDAGGVASGPMTATFLLPLAQGACVAVGGNIVTDAFGVVAMVAMTPLITVQMMGLVAQLRTRKARTAQPAAVLATVFADLPDDAIIEL